MTELAKVHEWPTGCLVFDEDGDGNPVNVRNEEVVPYVAAEKLYEALNRSVAIHDASDRLRAVIEAAREYREVVRGSE